MKVVLCHIPALVLCILLSLQYQGQNQNSQWYFGTKAGIDFMANPPLAIANSGMHVLEGCSSVSDDLGNLLFYTSGDSVWNRQHVMMANGFGLLGNNTSSQSSIIIKKPGSQSLYYIFTMQGITGAAGLNYSVVDMTMAAGMGSVAVKNASLYPAPSAEKLTATRHCNGVDFWIVTHDYNSANFRAHLLTSAGITSTVVTSIGPVITPVASSAGCMKISPTGRKIGMASYGALSRFEIFDFNNITGVVSNSLVLFVCNDPAGSGPYGCEFSPDGSKFYANRATFPNAYLYQWNLCAGSNNAIVASQVTIATQTTATLRSMQIAPDGKIYIARQFQSHVAVIHNPNLSGTACNFQDLGFSVFPRLSHLGVPNQVADRRTSFTFSLQGCLTASFTSPVNPSVQASCTSAGGGVSSIIWNFGDPQSGPANTSTLVNPVHTYPGPGTYTVKLILQNPCAADTITQVLFTGHMVSVLTPTGSCSGALATASVINYNPGTNNTYTWAPSGQTSSVVTGLSAGVHTLTINGGGCISTKTINIITPTVINAAVSTTLACPFVNNAKASVTVSNGSGAYNYSWSASSSQTWATVSGLSPGIHTVSVFDFLNQCTISQTFQINYLPSFTVNISGSPTVCAGKSVTLTVTGAHVYTWSPISPSATTSSVVVSPSVTTFYNAFGKDTLTGCTQSTLHLVTVLKSPTVAVTGPTTMCAGSTITLTATGADTYTWSNNATGSLLAISPQASLVVVANGSNSLNCISSASIHVQVHPVPIIQVSGNFSVCSKNTVTLTATGADSFIWTSRPPGATFVVSPVITSTYNVTGTNLNGQCQSVKTVTVHILPCLSLGDDEKETAGIIFFPNPSNGVFQAIIRNETGGLATQVYNAKGEMILQLPPASYVIHINIAHHPAGIYFIRCVGREGVTYNCKVVKE